MLHKLSVGTADAYAQWLGQTFHFVNNSTRLLALASAYTPYSQAELHSRFIDHAKEERGHEKLLIMDLKALGKTVEDIPELFPTAGLYKSQYYWIEHKSTSAFMGWILVLESVAAYFGPKVLERVTKTHGKSASHFWKVHAIEDQDHIGKAMREVEGLNEADMASFQLNFTHCTEFYISMLSECQQVAVGSLSKAA